MLDGHTMRRSGASKVHLRHTPRHSRSGTRLSKLGNKSQDSLRLPRARTPQASRLGLATMHLPDDEEEDEDEHETEFEDTDSIGSPTVDPPLALSEVKMEPTPPQLTDERVVSLTSLTEMANAMKDLRDRSGFVEDSDLVSTAVTRSQSSADLAKIVGDQNTRTQRRQLLKQRQPMNHREGEPHGQERREFEIIWREYSSCRTISNPVRASLERIAQEVYGMPHFNHRSNSLVATTMNQINDLSSKLGPNPAAAYVLNKIWQQGWQDPVDAHEGEDDSSEGVKSENFALQAQRAHSRISLARNNSTISLA